MPQLVDPETPDSAKTRTGFDGQDYELVFSDEFNTDGRTFYPGDDPFWEAVDLWYGSTQDLEWYDPAQVTTQGGALVITMESVTDVTLNHGLQYKSGMLQSWNKFCFTTGYIEVSITLPGPNSDTQGYVSNIAPSPQFFGSTEISGLEHGRWVTSVDRATGQHPTAHGRTRECTRIPTTSCPQRASPATTSAMWAFSRIRRM